MMKVTFLFVIVLVFLTTCKKKEDKTPSQKANITISDHSDSLTISSNDNLFILNLVSAPKTYLLSNLQITASLPGQTQNLLNFTLNDANGNNQFDQGESMIGIEPGGNIFDVNHINKGINVYFSELQPNGAYYQAATGIWTPAN